MDNRSTKIGNPVTDTKSEMRIITCPPLKFSGANVDYIPWKRAWEVTMGISYNEETQLMQLKQSIPARTGNLIGILGIRSMPDFWRHMDTEYLNYNTLSSSTIADINKKEISINCDDMVIKHWLSPLTETTKEYEGHHCHFCDETHPFGSHTRSRAESRKSAIGAATGQKWKMAHMQTATTCRRCNTKARKSQQTCGACGQTGMPGGRLHCFDHCLEFITAEPDDRLRQVLKHDDCTICLIRNHNTGAYLVRAAKKRDKLQTCGLYNKTSGSNCTSIKNTSFHGSAPHMQSTKTIT